MSDNYHYACPFSTCDLTYDAPVQPSDYPWCWSGVHDRAMDFIEAKSTDVPRHVKSDPGGSRKRGGNWIKKE